MTRADALLALLTAPFVVTVIAAVTLALLWLAWREPRHSDYMGIVEKARRGDG